MQSSKAELSNAREKMITEIETLVSIIKCLTDMVRSGTDLFGKRKKEHIDAVNALKARVAGLAAQLNETASLMTYIPAWVRQCDQAS